MIACDVVIVGGGIAGLAAGISFANAGRLVVLLERGATVSDGPGETLHPGVEAIFTKLGVAEKVNRAATARHGGIVVDRGGRSDLVPYGRDWRGYQIRKRTLSTVLTEQLRHLGGIIHYNSRAWALEQKDGHSLLFTNSGTYKTNWLIDASGMAGWLNRRTGARMTRASQPIWLRYGYRDTRNADSDLPHLRHEAGSWSFHAPLGDGETAWVACAGTRIGEFDAPSRGADGTWRISASPADNKCFRIGDAAFRLDPSSGNGVLRATMTAMLAAHLSIQTDDGLVCADQAAKIYNSWIKHWFESDARRLRSFGLEP